MTDTLNFVCDFDGCNKSFKRRDRLDVHFRTHTGKRPFVCHYDGCENSYTRSQHLSRHIQHAHMDGYTDLLKVRCPECKLELANSSCLKKHMRSFHDSSGSTSKSYKCPEDGCTEYFHKKKQLVVHRMQHSDHLSLAIRCHQCPHEGCGKTFTFPNKLKRHLKVHKGYPCDVEGCSQVLPNWSSLRKHKAVDHSPSHTCRQCGAVFKQKSNLKQHLKVHSEKKDVFPCPRDNCDRTFSYKKNLTQHIREFHDGEEIWKNKRSRRMIGPHKKRRSTNKKSMAARLCGVDKNGMIDSEIVMQERDVPETKDTSSDAGQEDVGPKLHEITSDNVSDRNNSLLTVIDSQDIISDHNMTSSHVYTRNSVNSISECPVDCFKDTTDHIQETSQATDSAHGKSVESLHIEKEALEVTSQLPENSISLSLPQQLVENIKCSSSLEQVPGSTVTIVIQGEERSADEVFVAVVR